MSRDAPQYLPASNPESSDPGFIETGDFWSEASSFTVEASDGPAVETGQPVVNTNYGSTFQIPIDVEGGPAAAEIDMPYTITGLPSGATVAGATAGAAGFTGSVSIAAGASVGYVDGTLPPPDDENGSPALTATLALGVPTTGNATLDASNSSTMIFVNAFTVTNTTDPLTIGVSDASGNGFQIGQSYAAYGLNSAAISAVAWIGLTNIAIPGNPDFNVSYSVSGTAVASDLTTTTDQEAVLSADSGYSVPAEINQSQAFPISPYAGDDGEWVVIGTFNVTLTGIAQIDGPPTDPPVGVGSSVTVPVEEWVQDGDPDGIGDSSSPSPAATVSVTADTGPLDAASGTPESVTFARTGDTSQAASYNFTSTGTATQGADYQLYDQNGQLVTTNAVTFGAGDSTETFTLVPIVDNANRNSDGTENELWTAITVTDSDSGTPRQSYAVVNINQPPLPQISVAAVDAAISEGFGDTEFMFTRTGDTSQGLYVPYTLGGDAIEGQSYFDTFGDVQFLPGQATAYVPFAAIDQGIANDSSETATLTLNDSPNYDVASGQASVTIVNNDWPSLSPGFPTLDTTATVSLGVAPTSGNDNPGILVASLLASSTSGDPIATATGAEGIAITGVDTSDGSWQYSSDGGQTWYPMPAGQTHLNRPERLLMHALPK